MYIHLQNAGKQYQNDWIFKKLDLIVNPSDRIGITGPNGSGKSTLLKILSGQTSLTRGKRIFKEINESEIEEEVIYKRISFAAPYIELIEEFNLDELILFYSKFRNLLPGLSIKEVIQISELQRYQKPVKSYSSGMKQRVKLLLAVFFQSDIVLLDEPSTNLDEDTKVWTESILKTYIGNRSLIIASNDIKDFTLTNKVIDIRNYKSA